MRQLPTAQQRLDELFGNTPERRAARLAAEQARQAEQAEADRRAAIRQRARPRARLVSTQDEQARRATLLERARLPARPRPVLTVIEGGRP